MSIDHSRNTPGKVSDKVSATIEAICERGCSQVNQLLETAKSGHKVDELSEFSEAEIQYIIRKLDQVMAIYNRDD